MSKHFTKTLLASAVLSMLIGSGTLAQADILKNITYSTYQQDFPEDQNSSKYLSSEKFKVLFDKGNPGGGGFITYGTNPDIKSLANQILYRFDAQGNVYTTLDNGKEIKIHSEDVADFVRSIQDGKNSSVSEVHNMSEGEIRSLIQEVDIIKKHLSSAENVALIAGNNQQEINKINSSFKSDEKTGSLSVGGHDAIAFGTSATAVGEGAYARENNTTAVGAYSTANAANSSALGVASQAYGKNSVAVGAAAHVAKDAANSVAVGTGASATYKNSVALGSQSVTTRDNEVNIGYKNSQGTGTRVLGGLSDGQLATDAATVGQLNQTKQTAQKNSQSIAANSRQLQEHNARLNDHQRQIRENHEEMKRAAAQSAALAGLFQPYSVGKFNATAALGGYSDKQAVAVGVGYRFNEQTAAKAGIAASDGDVSYNVGVNFEF
ncbi:TPA: YadA-like family protein [Escherichia coli]|nr:YadA-like family protein [Escherichia coli]